MHQACMERWTQQANPVIRVSWDAKNADVCLVRSVLVEIGNLGFGRSISSLGSLARWAGRLQPAGSRLISALFARGKASMRPARGQHETGHAAWPGLAWPEPFECGGPVHAASRSTPRGAISGRIFLAEGGDGRPEADRSWGCSPAGRAFHSQRLITPSWHLACREKCRAWQLNQLGQARNRTPAPWFR